MVKGQEILSTLSNSNKEDLHAMYFDKNGNLSNQDLGILGS